MIKKIVILLSMVPEEGGKFQYSISLLNGLESLDSDNYRIIAVYYDNIWIKYLNSKVEKLYIRKKLFDSILRKLIIVLPYGLIFWRKVSKYIDPAYKEIFKIKPDLIFIPGNYESSFEADIPAIVPIFDLMHRYEPHFPEVSKNSIFKKREYIYSKVSRYAKAILADSQIGKEHICQSYNADPSKVHILPYIYNKFLITSEESDCRSKFNLPLEYIFYPAQFWAHKNHCNLLKAIKLLQSENILVNAVFVGSKKNYYYKILELIKELEIEKQVFILDYVSNEELAYLYKHAKALVMPTYFGPTNIPPLEAFALGCPVLTSDIYAAREQLMDSALFFDPKSVAEMAHKIKLIYNNQNLRRELIMKGFIHNQKWNIESFNRRLKEIMDQIH